MLWLRSGYALPAPEHNNNNNNEIFLSYLNRKCEIFWTLPTAERVHFFTYRVPEEFYDFENDPNGRYNLIDHPNYLEETIRLQNKLEEWMIATSDPLLSAFQEREINKAENHT